jgi:Zn-dependent protease with chaperone function
MALIKSVFPMPVLNFVDDFIFIFMISYVVFNFNRVDFFHQKALFFLSVLVVFSMFYSVSNGNDVAAVLMYLRHYKNLFLFLILASFNANVMPWIFDFLKKALYISVPISIYQFNTADYSSTSWWDEVGGILGREGHSGTLSLLILSFVTFEYFRRLRDGLKLFDWYLIILIPMFINETKLVIFMFPIVFFAVAMAMGGRYRNKLIVLAPAFALGAFALNSLYYVFFESSPLNTLNWDFIEGYFFVDEDFSAQQIDIGRFTRILYAYDYLERLGLFFVLFGEGFGSTFFGNTSGVEGKVVSTFFDLRLHTGSRHQLYQMILDFGVVGTGILYATFLYYWYKVLKIKNKTNEVIFALVLMPVFLISTVYQAVIESKVVFLLLMLSLFYSLRKVR